MPSFLASSLAGLCFAALTSVLVSAQSSLVPVATVCTPKPACPATAVQVPAPWYSLTFPVNPTSLTGATSNLTFGWENAEAGDALCQYQHQGIATFNASLNQFMDLNQVIGGNSSGYALPGIVGGIGAGNVAQGTAGWSFETTIRVGVNSGNSKVSSMGQAAYTNDIYFSMDGGTPTTGLLWGAFDGQNTGNDGHSYSAYLTGYTTYQWYHLVAVTQQLTTNPPTENGAAHGAWFTYVNGQLVTYPGGTSQINILPPAVQRLSAYLAKSNWNDPFWNGLIDTWRIYNTSLSASQVGALYAGEMAGCPVTTGSAVPATIFPLIAARTASGPVTPFFSANFSTSPFLTTSGASGYNWVQTRPGDTPLNQILHQGLLGFGTGSTTNDYVNLALASGANSIGQVLPPIGGGTAGWSFELMFYVIDGADAWAKLMDIGSTRIYNNNPLNDFVLGWDGNARAPDTFWQFALQDNTTSGNGFSTDDALGEVATNTWNQAVAVITPPQANGLCNYFTYINGALYSSVVNAYCPVLAVRQNSYLARSGWSDPYFHGYLDTFNVYNQALSDVQISNLYAAATAQPVTPVNTVCLPAPACLASPTGVPTAWYNLNFANNPSAVVGANPTWTWEASEAGDAQCQYQHQGIAKFNGANNNFIDLNQATGANSSGTGSAIPSIIGGPSSGSLNAGTAGWTFEITFRAGANPGYSKPASLGKGPYSYNILFSQDGNTDGGLQFALIDGNTQSSNTDGHQATVEPVSIAVLGQWYHIVAVTQQVTAANLMENNATHGAWFIYVNGQLIYNPQGIVENNMLPPAVTRAAAYLAKSNWNDPYWSGLIDTFRIYDYALTQSQVLTLYSGEMGGCTVPVSTAAPSNTFPNLMPRNTAGAVTPYFSATFDHNPLLYVPGASGYNWAYYLPSDTLAQQSIHQGVLTLSGNPGNQFVNLALGNGSNSIGQVLGPIGGGSSGWTFEIEVISYSGGSSWPKLIDIGSSRPNGVPLNDIVLGWDGDARNDFFWQFAVQDNSGNGYGWSTGDALGEIPYGQWFHAVAVITPPSTVDGNCTYLTYLNGQLYTTVVQAYCPQAAVRDLAYLGRSGWNDPYFNGAIDFFNVYSQALSDTQVASLYTASQTVKGAPTSTGGVGPSTGGSSLATQTTICSAVPTCPTTPVGVPTAWLNLNFAVNPTSITGASNPTFGWEASDAGDAQCGYQHTGIVTFNGTLNQYIDLGYASGANSSGSALPSFIGGPSAGSVAAGTAGWTFEATVRLGANFGYSKFASIGAGTPLSNILFTGDGADNGGLQFALYDNTTSTAGVIGHVSAIELVNNPYVRYQWYHLVAVTQQVSNNPANENGATHGAWFFYINGKLLTFPNGVNEDNIMPPPVARPAAFLAKSNWQDPYWTGLMDTFRIYNYALSQSQVTQLYAGDFAGCAVPASTAVPADMTPNFVPTTATGPVVPTFSANFNTNPLTTTAGASGYGWNNSLNADSAATRSLRQGLLGLNGNGQFVNLALASGANSIGQTLPTIGGGSSGWTFEIELLTYSGADSWPKVFDIGTSRNGGNPRNDIVLGWDGDDRAPDNFWQFAVEDNSGNGYGWATVDALGEIPYGTWVHATAVILPPRADGYTTYLLYVNGQLYTTVTNAFYPVAAVRDLAYIGKSGWSDPYFNGWVDFFNIYAYALSGAQVANLYAATQTAAVAAPTATGYLCLIVYSLPGNVDYPWSVSVSMGFTYNPTPINNVQGSVVQMLSGSGTRVFTNRFGNQISSRVTLSTSGGTPLLYLGNTIPFDTTGITYTTSTPVQLPGIGPMQTFSSINVFSSSGGIEESGATRTDQFGQAFLSNVPGFNNVTIGASNVNSLAANFGQCLAPITFTNGLRVPTQPNNFNGAAQVFYSYTISDGVTYNVQANLTLFLTSPFGSVSDQLGNPFQTIYNVTGTRTYTYIPTGAMVVSQVTGLSTAQTNSQPSNRLYPYSLLASAPGVYTSNTAPYLDGEGIEYGLNNLVPILGNAPGAGTLWSAVTVNMGGTTNSIPTSLISEVATRYLPLATLQQQVYRLITA